MGVDHPLPRVQTTGHAQISVARIRERSGVKRQFVGPQCRRHGLFLVLDTARPVPLRIYLRGRHGQRYAASLDYDTDGNPYTEAGLMVRDGTGGTANHFRIGVRGDSVFAAARGQVPGYTLNWEQPRGSGGIRQRPSCCSFPGLVARTGRLFDRRRCDMASNRRRDGLHGFTERGDIRRGWTRHAPIHIWF